MSLLPLSLLQYPPHTVISYPEQGNCISKPSNIVLIARHTLAININHTLRPNRIQVIHRNPTRPFNTKDLALTSSAAPLGRARRVVVREEAVQASGVGEDAAASVGDAHAPAIAVVGEVGAGAGEVEAGAVEALGGEDGVVPGGLGRDWKGCWGVLGTTLVGLARSKV